MKFPPASVRELAKKIGFRHFGLGKPNYPYGIEPALLARIVQHIERLDDPGANIVEAGVARGMTTRFIVQTLTSLGKPNRLYPVDTFAGFVAEHLEFEQDARNKNASDMHYFEYNDFDVWSGNFREFPQVKPMQGDIGTFDFSQVAPVAIFVLDVDLYVPTKAALANVMPHMAKGGAVYLDDIRDQNIWDGAYQAFVEFTKETGVRHEFVGNESGIIFAD